MNISVIGGTIKGQEAICFRKVIRNILIELPQEKMEL